MKYYFEKIDKMNRGHAEVINIIENTVHGYTQCALREKKFFLMRWCRIYCQRYISIEEQLRINQAMDIVWNPADNVSDLFKTRRCSEVTFQFLCDLTTNILYAKGIDVWEIIMSTERRTENG